MQALVAVVILIGFILGCAIGCGIANLIIPKSWFETDKKSAESDVEFISMVFAFVGVGVAIYILRQIV